MDLTRRNDLRVEEYIVFRKARNDYLASILPIAIMDSGFALRAPRNDKKIRLDQ
jgi:hypothetical protein